MTTLPTSENPVPHYRRSTPLPAVVGLTLMVAVTVALTGCSAGFSSSAVDDFGSFRVDVTNDLAPRVQVYLQVEPESGSEAASEALLGGAPVEGTTVFHIDVDDFSASHRLRAALPRNREVLSETFVPGELAGVRWMLADNRLTPERRGESGGNDPSSTSSSAEGSAESVGPDHRRPTGARRIPPGS